MGTIKSSGCSKREYQSNQAICQFIINGISGKTFNKIKWRVRIDFHGGIGSTWNILFENVTESETIFEEVNWQPDEDTIENGSYNYANKGIKNNNWVGDTLRLTATKQSGDNPDVFTIVAITQTWYSD